jgi:hypothetical protein
MDYYHRFANDESSKKSRKIVWAFYPILSTFSSVPKHLNNLSLLNEDLYPYLIKDSVKRDGFTFYDTIDLKCSPKLLVPYFYRPDFAHIDLLDVNSSKLIKRWSMDFKKLGIETYNNSEGLQHPLLVQDSSIIAIAANKLLKIDKHSKVIWTLPDIVFHHSLEKDDEGNIFGCTYNTSIKKYSFFPTTICDNKDFNMRYDYLTKVNGNSGEIIYSKNVLDILVENGYKKLLYPNGNLILNDIVHLNEVNPALTSTKHWNKGDLLISCRTLSILFIYRPTTNKIIWLKQGPWMHQHSPSFLPNNQIAVLSNSSYDYLKQVFHTSDKDLDQKLVKTSFYTPQQLYSQVFIYDFETNEVTEPYKNMLEKEKFQTTFEGRLSVLPDKSIFIEETNKGRIFIGDFNNKKIEFTKRIDRRYITKLIWSRAMY